MKLVSKVLVLSIMYIWSLSVLALPEEQKKFEDTLTQIAKERCHSEQIEGKDYSTKILGDGNIEISFFGKKGGELKGTFIYTREQWEGRQKVLQEHQAQENIDHRQCIRYELDSLRSSYTPPSESNFSPNYVIKTKPIAYYSFDNSLKLGLDDSGNGKTGRNEGATVGFGVRKMAACFNGRSKIVIDSFRKYSWGSSFSVSTWFIRNGEWQNYQGIINNGYHTKGSWEIRMGRENNGTFLGGGVITSNSPETWDYKGLQASQQEWHHVVMTYDGTKLSYFLDTKEKIGKGDVSGDIFIKNTPVTIGQAGIGIDKEYFYGCIDEVAIYDYALSKDNIIKLYNTIK